MPNELFQKWVLGEIQTGLRRIHDLDGVDHPGMRGRLREVFINDVLRKVLPESFGIDTGKIIDSTGQVSPQIDVIVHFKEHFPRIELENGVALVPCENVFYAIEVKSTLTAEETRSTMELFRKTRELCALLGENQVPARENLRIRFALVAVKSDLTDKTDFERLKELDNNYRSAPAIPILVTPSGYHDFGFSNQLKRNGWFTQPRPLLLDGNLVAFIGHLVNTVLKERRVRETIGSFSFAGYFFDAENLKVE